MTQSSVTPMPALAPLDYARGAVVGAVRVERRADGFTLTLGRSTPVLRVGVAFLALGAALALTGVVLVALVPSGRGTIQPLQLLWILAFVLAIGCISGGANAIVVALHPRELQLSDAKMSFTFRAQRQVGKLGWPAPTLVDVYVRPVAFRRNFSVGHVVRGVLTNGQHVEFRLGTREECEFVRTVLVDALRLPAEPWVEAGFPRLRWFSRVELRPDPTGVWVHQPPRFAWSCVFAGVLLVPASVVVAAYVLHSQGRSWERIWDQEYLQYIAGVIALVAALVLVLVVNNLRRTTSVLLNPGGLVLEEKSPIRPALVKWPTEQLREFLLRRVRPGCWAIDVRMEDGSSSQVLSSLYHFDASVLVESLTRGLQRAKATQLAVPPHSDEDDPSKDTE